MAEEIIWLIVFCILAFLFFVASYRGQETDRHWPKVQLGEWQ